jgi:probable HAF family extracellular repeat protein
MALSDRTSIRRRGLAAIAAGVFTALAVASSGPAWGQEAGDPAAAPAASQAGTLAPAGMMQMLMGGTSDSGDAAPPTGHGFLLDKGVFTTIDHPDAVAESAALGINNRGQIVGGYVDADGTVRSFLLDDGVFTPIEHPDAASGTATGTAVRSINDRGQIVGFYVDAEGAVHGFLLEDGAYTTIDHPDASLESGAGTAAFGLDNRGQIVGFYLDAGAEAVRGFVLDTSHDALAGGDFITIDFPGAVETLAAAIDDRGQVAGAYGDTEGTQHGFLRDKEGAFTTIDHPDAAPGINAGTLILGLNNRGQIVGQYLDAELLCHGLLLSRGAFRGIDDPDAELTTGASDINDRGQIVGFRDGLTGLKACPPLAASTSASTPESTEK